MTTTARVARYERPGKRWFIAVCEECRWVDMSWKHRGWAADAARQHDETRHAPISAEPA